MTRLFGVLAHPTTGVIIGVSSLFTHQLIRNDFAIAKRILSPCKDNVTIYHSQALVSDFSSSVYYTSIYDWSNTPQNYLSVSVNDALGIEEQDYSYKLIKNSSNKIIVGTIYSSSIFITDILNGHVPTANDWYKLAKPAIKHGSILLCKYYTNPLSIVEFPNINIYQIANGALCNIVGEVAEGIIKWGYTLAFSDKPDYYEINEIIADIFYGVHKVFHQKVEKFSGKFLKALFNSLDASGLLEEILDNIPLHFHISGVLRRIFTKIYSHLAKNITSTYEIDENIEENNPNSIEDNLKYANEQMTVVDNKFNYSNLLNHLFPTENDSCANQIIHVKIADKEMGCIDDGDSCKLLSSPYPTYYPQNLHAEILGVDYNSPLEYM